MTPRRGRRLGVSVALAVAVTGATLVGLAPAAHASPSDNSQVLAHLNALRESHGLSPLTINGQLSAVATAWAQQLAKKEGLEHNPALADDVSNWHYLGENVGMGPNAAAIDTAFDQSPPHYANEVDTNYTEVGIGTAYDSRNPSYLYITVDFETPFTASTPVVTTVVQAPVTHQSVAKTSTPTTVHRTVVAKKPVIKVIHKVKAKPVAPALPAAPKGNDPIAEAFTFNATLSAQAS